MCYPAEDAITTVSIENEYSTSIPTSITVTMSTNTPANNPMNRKFDGSSDGSVPSLANDLETSVFYAKILEELEAIKGDVQAIKGDVEAIKGDVRAIKSTLNPRVDPFFKEEFVEQSGNIEKRHSTWTLMKIKQDDAWQCIGVSSAHLIDCPRPKKKTFDLLARPAEETFNLFINLPKSFYVAGVSAVMLHPRIMDDKPNTNVKHCDLMIVVLNTIPREDIEMNDLKEYPEHMARRHNPMWRQKLILGRSSVDFVRGRCLSIVEGSNEEFHYVFLSDRSEKGDSGTILYADFGDEKELVGLYMGTKRGDRSIGDRGIITPAIGWGCLTKLEPIHGLEKVSVNTYKKKVFSVNKYTKKEERKYVGCKTTEYVARENSEHGTYELEREGSKLYGTILEVGAMNSSFQEENEEDSENHDIRFPEEDGYETGCRCAFFSVCRSVKSFLEHVFRRRS